MDNDTPTNHSLRNYFLSFVLIIGLVAFTGILILALMGPTIGNIFSNVSKGLSRDGGGGGSYGGSVSSVAVPRAVYRPATAAPALNSALAVMKAGEIDDNAQWDVYTQFRRDFMMIYPPQSVIDVDVAERRIIKVVDAEGHPILGAHVEIYAASSRISESLTYATGMTLFLPNANARTQGLDEFQMVVTYGETQVMKTLSLRAVGDVIEISLPLLFSEDDTPPRLMTVTPSSHTTGN